MTCCKHRTYILVHVTLSQGEWLSAATAFLAKERARCEVLTDLTDRDLAEILVKAEDVYSRRRTSKYELFRTRYFFGLVMVEEWYSKSTYETEKKLRLVPPRWGRRPADDADAPIEDPTVTRLRDEIRKLRGEVNRRLSSQNPILDVFQGESAEQYKTKKRGRRTVQNGA